MRQLTSFKVVAAYSVGVTGKYRLEHVGVLDDGTGIFDFRVPRDQQDTLIEDMTELFSDNYVERPACISFAGRG